MRISDWSSDVCSSDLQDDAADEEQQIGRGLHAKLLFWRTGRSRTLWLGSANATRQAWSGRNAEATLELRITEGVVVGLKALVGAARCIPVPEREFEPDAVTLEERSEEHTSELQSLMRTLYAGFCLKTKNQKPTTYSIPP